MCRPSDDERLNHSLHGSGQDEPASCCVLAARLATSITTTLMVLGRGGEGMCGCLPRLAKLRILGAVDRLRLVEVPR